jgi:hypothetical protein
MGNKPKPERRPDGTLLPGHDVGVATRFPPGVSPNPGGHSALEREYKAYLEQRPIELNVTADITAARKESDEQLEFIVNELARYAASREAAGNIVEARPGEAQILLEGVGETEPA